MNILIIYTHPNPGSFNHAILETVKNAAEAKGHNVTVRDLYSLGFNPVLTPEDLAAIQAGKTPEAIKTEQAFIEKSDLVIAVHPIWWTGLPAMYKGYIDRVFSYGFAYAITENGIKGLLGDKKIIVFNTTGMPDEVYGPMGMHDSLKMTSDKGIYEFSGIKVLGHHFFGGVTIIDDAARKALLERIVKILDEQI